jgi:membrane carboxypeptidase/penicillin-binding protein
VRGTAAGAAGGLRGDLAGKTGTTNKRRDSWFAGYSPERATVVWVGYDDNSTTRLSGARAALPIWTRFTTEVAPRAGYSNFRPPKGVTTATIDPTSGLLATEFCPVTFTEVFRQGEVPTESCNRHQSWYDVEVAEAVAAGEEEDLALPEEGEERGEEKDRKAHPFKRWLNRVFGEKDKDRDAGRDRDRTIPPPR